MLPHLEAISRLGNEIKEKGAQLLHVSDESKLQAGLDDIALLFLELQKWNRATLIHTKSIKSTTSEYKQVMDRTFLNLQNLNYERLHIQREIDNCRDFESIFQNVDLISEEDFRALFPHMSGLDEHQLMLERLNHEKEERMRLLSRENDLKKERDSLKKDVLRCQAELDAMDKELLAFEQSTLPLQQKLHVNYTEERAILDNALALPRPLYIMYEQFMAYKTLFDDGNFVCSIVGNDDGASQTRRRKSNARLDKESLLNGDSSETMELDNYKHSLEVHVQIKGASSNEHLSLCFSFVYPSEVVAVSSALIGGRRTFSLDSLFREEDSIDDRANSCYTLRIGDEDLKSYFWAKIVSGGTMNGMGADPSSLKVPERGSGMKIHVAKLMRAIKARYKAWNLFNSEVNKECGASRGSTDHSRGRFISVTFLTEEESSRETTRGGLFWVFDLAASAAKVREYHFTIHVPVEFPDRRCFFGVKSLPVSLSREGLMENVEKKVNSIELAESGIDMFRKQLARLKSLI